MIEAEVAREFVPRAPRTRTCLNGKLVHGDGAYTVDCAVRDLSQGGAKIVLREPQALPHEMHLIVVKHRVAHEARVMWLNFPARGLRFSRTYVLSGMLPEELNFLRLLWGAIAPASMDRLS